MSRAKTLIHTVSLLGLAALSACASSPSSEEAAEMDVYQKAMLEAAQPATPEEIALAERSDPLTRANFWGEEYRKDASNVEVIVPFMRALRAIGSHDRVQEIATVSLPQHPRSHEILLELGRSFMAQDRPEDAVQAFVRAADFAPADQAAPLAALGVAFDRTAEHLKAQKAYRFALEREPDRVATLSNYGLSLALTGNLVDAEAQLRKASALPDADIRIRQNLALILGLQGKFDEMASVDPSAPRRTVEANREALRQMMLPARSYSGLDDEMPARPTPRLSEPMPDVREAMVEDEPMPMLNTPQTASTDTTGELEGGDAISATAPKRPRLRGSQGG